ncbi:MAG TPA: ATP-binding protein [Blastocatellia bacterium]|jgi:SpoVK/Ycf46/Vps4 family AAA+-type ATPase|nr:ATP-binding protein [Blastocatellia bacterium]
MSAQAEAPAIDLEWLESNRRDLLSALAEVRRRLEHYLAAADDSSSMPARGAEMREPREDAAPSPSALESLCAVFRLSAFERHVLLLCAGVELDSSFASLCAAAQDAVQGAREGDAARPYPTFSLALAALGEPHWSALTPVAPLRQWRLIEVAGDGLMTSPLRIDERVLHYLAGIQHMDARLAGMVAAVKNSEELVPSHRLLAERIAALWMENPEPYLLPVVQLNGSEILSKEAVASRAAESVGLSLGKLSAHAIPSAPADLEAFARLCEREAILGRMAIYLDCHDLDPSDSSRAGATARLIESFKGGVIVGSRARLRERGRLMVALDVTKPETAEQVGLWRAALKAKGNDSKRIAKKLASQFNLSQAAIRSAGLEAMSLASAGKPGQRRPAKVSEDALWDICRAHTRPRLEDLAERIEPRAGRDDLILPEAQKEALAEIVLHVRNRATVYEDWGFAARSPRGLGITALFAGASGTGKTMAAEVVAGELRLDLYRIDLSSVVSKYIGETEKNLRRVFDAADEGGAVLLFDEADALFGKRSEVKDSHDRYANIEVGYLLQRMESYKGLAILTSNFKEAMDTAFLRRIRFLVQFPFPDAARRAEIWKRIFPRETPTEGLDAAKLARVNVTGGSIRNIALNAAFLAAEEGEPVRMRHLLRATRSEYAKLERPLTEAEIGGWI